MDKSDWTSYGEVYNVIVSAVHNDYAGYEEAAERDMPQLGARASLYNSRYFHGDDSNFLYYTRQYLTALGDPNLSVRKVNPDPVRDWDVGFSVRAAQDALYVTECTSESRLSVGDRIIRIDGLTPYEYRSNRRRLLLYGLTPERELWDHYLKYSAELTVRHAGSDAEETVYPIHYPIPGTAARADAESTVLNSDAGNTDGRVTHAAAGCQTSVKTRQGQSEAAKSADSDTAEKNGILFYTEKPGICRIEMIHFQNPDAIFDCVNMHESEIASSDTLILDLRRCRGGDWEVMLPFLTFLISEPVTAADLFPDKGLYYKYSYGNRSRVPEMAEEDPSLKGYVWEENTALEDLQVQINPAPGPGHVLILTDLYTRDEAEQFVQLASPLPKVQVIGRSTMGNSDYRDLLTISFEDDLLFTYPIAKTKAAMEGHGILRYGLTPDIHVPWTPEECDRDVILEEAMKIAEKKE